MSNENKKEIKRNWYATHKDARKKVNHNYYISHRQKPETVERKKQIQYERTIKELRSMVRNLIVV